MGKKKMKVQPIKEELRPLLEQFLDYEDYMPLFKEFAKVMGYHGDDEKKIKQILFAPNEDGEIGFTVEGMYELFLEFQLMMQLAEKEPYASLLKEYPEAIRNIRKVAIKAFNKEDLTEEDLVMIFNTEQYEKERAEWKRIEESKDSAKENEAEEQGTQEGNQGPEGDHKIVKLRHEVEKILSKYDFSITVPEGCKNIYTDGCKPIEQFDDAEVMLYKKYKKYIPDGWYGFATGLLPIEWYNAIDEVLELLIKHDKNFEIHQIKLKWGGIRFYTESAVIEDLFEIETLIEESMYNPVMIW